MSPADCERFFSALARAIPSPATELIFSGPFELLVAVVLSAQATDKSVNKATKRLFAVANSPGAIVALGEDGVKAFIRTIGLFNSKARHIVALSRLLIERHGGAVPEDRAALEALPGVGRKTANVVLNTAFGHETVAVDTHIFRVANRTGLAPGRTVLDVEKTLLRVVPEAFIKDAHHLLILHGRYTCMARAPKCAACPVASLCSWPLRPASG